MTRIQQKVKDLIDVRSYEGIQDFLSDPAQTLSSYHFTDITSNMMAQWLDKILAVEPGSGAASALAGYRGVGKSHFLAAIGAIAGHPELRSRITQPHVAASAQRFKRRRYPVVYVRRGTQVNLIDELKDGIAGVFEADVEGLSDDLPELLGFAEKKAEDLPLIILVDTAHGRASRVSRDDGNVLSEIAEIAKSSHIYVAVALDDDITGADGINSSIVRSYTLDYLDQEHLYRIVDQHIFPKHRQSLAAIKDIYTNFKTVMPDFRWSEPRFTALYPLHPVILEIAPAIRLYAPEFTLLGFASEAGTKIMGRPANSLIALDEVFDSVEESLRKIPDLKQAFEIYDKLNTDIVAHIPVMERLQAKLILKGLMLLSLEGEGTSQGAIRSSMLIYNENEPEKAKTTVEGLLETFVSVFPENIRQIEDAEAGETLYSLKVDSKDNLNQAIADAAQEIGGEVIPKILRRMARERFFDWDLPGEDGQEEKEEQTDFLETRIVWRGSRRTGRVTWDLENSRGTATDISQISDRLDWEIIVNPHEVEQTASPNEPAQNTRVFWQPAPLKKNEADTILRYYVLLTDQRLREEYGEQVQAAVHAHTISVERIWSRIFLQDSRFMIDGVAHAFSEEARAAQSLTEMLAVMLEPFFTSRYPNHPRFTQTLGMDEVSVLVSDFFSGARQNIPEVQQLAEFFALPLELVYLEDDVCHLESEENIINLPLSKGVLSLIRDDQTVSLEKVAGELSKPPYGLTREAQSLLLSALIAHRQIEFVTSKGDRIGRRSLDLQIIWDDVVGIARPAALIYNTGRLAHWAQMLTGAEELGSIETDEEIRRVKEALGNWLNDWRETRVLERFNQLPDEVLNTKVWSLAARAEKTFGAMAGIIGEIVEGNLAVENGLHRVAEVFSDSDEEFFHRTKDLVVLEDFIEGARTRREIESYLAVCETTADTGIEAGREKLLELIERTYFEPKESLNRELRDVWEDFHQRFSDYYADRHDFAMKPMQLQEKLNEITGSDAWWEFENLSRLPIFPQIHSKRVQQICRRITEADCRYEVREMLRTHPFCACSFRLSRQNEWEDLPAQLTAALDRARSSYRKVLALLKQFLVPLIEQFWSNNQDEEFGRAANHLIEVLNDEEEIPLLTKQELIILQRVLAEIPAASLLQVSLPDDPDLVSPEELRARINSWIDELPGRSVLFKI